MTTKRQNILVVISNNNYFYGVQANLALCIANLPFLRERLKAAIEQYDRGELGNYMQQQKEYDECIQQISSLLTALS